MDVKHHNTTSKLTRVQFFDILCEKSGQVSNEEFSSPLHQKLYGGIVPKYISADVYSQNKKLPMIPPRSMSIPLDDGLQMGWAPNGYGKTFVFKNLLAPIWDKKYGWTPSIAENPYNSAGETIEEALEEAISHLDDYMSDCLKKMDWDTKKQAENKLFPFRALALGLQTQGVDLGIAFFFDLRAYSEESNSNSKSVRLEVSEIAIFPGFSELENEEYISQPNWIPSPGDEETCWLVRNNSSFEWRGQAKNTSNLMDSVIYAVASFLRINCTYLETPEQSMVDFKQRINEYGRGFLPHLAELSSAYRRPTPYDKKQGLFSLDSIIDRELDPGSPLEKLVVMLLQNVNSVSSPLRMVQQDIVVQEIGKQLEELESMLSLLIFEPQTGKKYHQEEDILLYVLHELLFTETEEHEYFRYTVFTSILEIFVKLDDKVVKKQKTFARRNINSYFHDPNLTQETVRDPGLYYQMAESLHLEYLFRSQEVDFDGMTGAEILRVRLPSAMDFKHPYLTHTALNIGSNWYRWDEREAALLQLESFSELAEEPSLYESMMLRYVMRNDADSENVFWDVGERFDQFFKMVRDEASFFPILDFVKQPLLVSIYEILHHMNAMIANNGPWSISVEYDSSQGNFLFSPSNHQLKHSISPKHLSFGMRSELLMQCAMIKHILDVRKEVSASMINTHYLLILDESEVGRSEAWTKKLIDRFHLLEDQLGLLSSQTVLAVSHRGIVLERGRSDGRYALLHNLLDDEDEEF